MDAIFISQGGIDTDFEEKWVVM